MNKKRQKKTSPMRAPIGIENDYIRKMDRILEAYWCEVEFVVISELPGLFAMRDRAFNLDASNDFGVALERLLDRLRIRTNSLFTSDRSKALAYDIGQRTSNWNSAEWQRTIRIVFGINLFSGRERWLLPLLKTFSLRNARLIRSIRDVSIDHISSLLTEALSSGARWEVVARQLRARYKTKNFHPQYQKDKNRIRFIARDQVSKLNGQLTQLRQVDSGVSSYIWRTSLDERVRKSHKAHEFKKFRWDNPPAGTGHPGNDFQCRCTAEPVFDKKFLEKNGIINFYPAD